MKDEKTPETAGETATLLAEGAEFTMPLSTGRPGPVTEHNANDASFTVTALDGTEFKVQVIRYADSPCNPTARQ